MNHAFSELLGVLEAQALMLEEFKPLDAESVNIKSAFGRVLAKTIVSPLNLPLFNNSSMDGFAVLANDTVSADQSKPLILKIVGDIPAGRAPEGKITTGEAMRVMTGAVIPEGADAVIPIELTDQSNQTAGMSLPESIKVDSPVEPGAFIRLSGEDIKQNDIVMLSGTILRPQEIGFLAMLGIPEVAVHRRAKVALFSTGDELIPLSEELAPGKIFDSNKYSLSTLITKYGGEVFELGIAADSTQSVTKLLDQAVEKDVDLILTSAGVSVGAFDYVRTVVEKNGSLTFWRVNMRPGKPLAFGNYKNIPFIGLPGNPVSAFVCFEVFVRPVFMRMNGRKNVKPIRFKVKLMDTIESDGRESYLRAFVWREKDRFLAHLVEHQGSGNLYSLVKANAFVIVPSEVKSLPVGSQLEAWIFDANGIEDSFIE